MLSIFTQAGPTHLMHRCRCHPVAEHHHLDTIEQGVRLAREHGACAVLMRPIEGDKLLHDPYFFPIYEEASRLNMPIAVHIAESEFERELGAFAPEGRAYSVDANLRPEGRDGPLVRTLASHISYYERCPTMHHHPTV